MTIVRHPLFRWILTAVLLYLMAWQLYTKSDHFNAFRLDTVRLAGGYIFLVFLLMPLNWFLEMVKWQHFLRIHAPIPFAQLVRPVLGGIALSIFTPNRIGEYGGRILRMPYEIRWPVALSTLAGSICQNLVAFSAGVLSFILIFPDLLFLKVLAILSVSAVFIGFFNLRMIISWVCSLRLHPVFQKVLCQLRFLEDYSPPVLFRGLSIAAARYIIYVGQFVILLHVFSPGIPLGTLFLGVSALYLFHTIVPLPPVADVLARTNVALILWSGSGMSELSISLASLLVWCINLLIPAIIGSIILSTTTPGNSFNTHDQHLSPSYKPVIADQPPGT